MAKPIRLILWIVGILLCLLVILSILAAVFLPPFLKSALETQLNRVTGGQAQVGSVSAFPPGSASATNITVTGTRWSTVKSFEVATLDVTYNPFALLGQYPEDAITSIKLNGFVVHASKHPAAPRAQVSQNSTNATTPKTSNVLAAYTEPITSATAPMFASQIPTTTTPAPATSPIAPPVTPVGRSGNSHIVISLANGVLLLDEQEVAREITGELLLLSFDRLEGQLVARALGGDPGNLTVSGYRIFSTNQGSTQISGDHLPLGPLLALTFLGNKIVGSGGSVSLKAGIEDGAGKTEQYNIALTVHSGQLQVAGIRSQIFEVNGDASMGPSGASISGFTVKVGQWKVPFTVSGSLSNYQTPYLDLRCTAEKVNLGDLTALFSLENRNLLSGLNLQMVGLGKLICTIKGPLARPEVGLRIESVNIAGYQIPTDIGKVTGGKGIKIDLRLPRKKK